MHDGSLYDTKLKVQCEVGKLNGTTACLPAGMWEEVGTVYAEPTCAKLYNWGRADRNPCLSGKSPFVLAPAGAAGTPQTCGDFRGIIWAGTPTALHRLYDQANKCSDFGVELDLVASHVFDFGDAPKILREDAFVDPATETGCTK